MHVDPALEAIGLTWLRTGQSALSGPLLDLAERLDRSFLQIAEAFQAKEHRFPPMIEAAELHRLDYFRSFPQLATFPVSLDDAEENLRRFVEGDVLRPDGGLALTASATIDAVLTPAACYPIYIHAQATNSDRARYFTVRATCYRREDHFEPLVRQRAFTMREIVCIGTADEVRQFLAQTRAWVARWQEAIGLPIAWLTATDPFFMPSRSSKHLMQRLLPTKVEMTYEGRVAIGSVNLHQDHFGATFVIERDGRPAQSGCVAFGIERWIHAITKHFGKDPDRWPRLEEALAASRDG
ncbi:aminoacyl--tRNA ligase-related protein [Polyangium sp. y55x31]|uniref:aminoacyl--tRNA ligase-related protein n=1 Tax=Polyangium sp. y55x31 TaxID=3042688 RepID=UPI002482BE3E|nr:aminoacyl--tRNA ligase-related protein [Polyangium sp. y55x31]MDI1480359.1 hypothetical protein [Polyangium sp. y55x31]